MKNGLRNIPSFLAAAMLTACVGTTVFAGNSPTITVQSKETTPGETVDITVSLSDNPGLVSMLLEIGYADDTFALTKVTDAGVLGAQSHSNDLTLNPYVLYWSNGTATTNFTVNGTVATLTFDVAADAVPGEYPITVSYDKENDGIFNVEFFPVEFATANGKITVKEKPKENMTGITLSDKSFAYDGTVKSLAVAGKLPTGATVEYENNGKSDAGEYTVKATVKADGYNDLSLSAKLTITKKALTVSGITASNKTYDGTTDAVLSGGTLSGAVSGDDVSVDFPPKGTFAKKDIGTGIAVTIPTLTLKGDDAKNYTLTQPASLKANITAAPLTVKADDKSVKIGDKLPELTYTITSGKLFGSDTLTGALSTKGTTAKAGTFDITQGTLKASGNYVLTFTKGTLTVQDKTAQNIKVSTITAKTYGDEAFKIEVTPDAVSALNNFTFTSSNTSVATVAKDGTVTIKAAGTTTITVAEAGNDDYAAFSKAQTLTVNKAALAVKADDKSVKIGDKLPELTYTITSGKLFGTDTLTGALSTKGTTAKAGTFDITQGTLKATDNYALTFTKGTLTVSDKTVQNIKVSTITDKTYGDEAFKIEVTPDAVSGLNHFTFTSSNTNVAAVANDGTVTIKAAGTTTITVAEAGNDEYAAFSKAQTLTVAKVAVEVTPDAVTKRLGTADPELTYTYTGKLVGEDSFTGALTRKAGEKLGKYAITAGTLALNGNYTLTVKTGVMFEIVDKTPQNIKVDEVGDKTYGDEPFKLVITPDEVSKLNEFTFSSDNEAVAAVAADGTVEICGAGTVVITVSEAGNDDYAAAEVNLTINVAKKAVTINAIDLNNKTAELDGILTDDTAAIDFNKLTMNILDGTLSPASVEATDLALVGENADNYALSVESVATTVDPENIASVTVLVENGTVEGDGNHLIGSEVTLTAVPETKSRRFNGWYIDGKLVSSDLTYTFTANESASELTAKFARGGGSVSASGGSMAKASRKVHFEADADEAIADATVIDGEKAGKPQNPVKKGFIFEGWFADKDGTTPFDFDKAINADTTVYAKWTKLSKKQIVLTIGEKLAKVFDEDKENDVAPKIVNDRTMLPARFVAESLGAKVDWDEKDGGIVTIIKDDIVIIIFIGKDTAKVNGEDVKLDAPAFIENDRTYTPIRFISENLGATVDWDDATKKVTITTK